MEEWWLTIPVFCTFTFRFLAGHSLTLQTCYHDRHIRLFPLNFNSISLILVTIAPRKPLFILLPTVNFSPVRKDHISAQHKMFVAKFVRFMLYVYCHVMSAIYCTNLFACGRSLTHGNWQQRFIQIIHYEAHFVKLVIISALIIGLFVLKCR